MAKITDIERWRTEILLAEKYRKDEFGEYDKDHVTGVGENIEYYERGQCSGFLGSDVEDRVTTTLNLFHAISNNILPALYYKNPTINVLPKRREDSDSAYYAKHIINHYYKEISCERSNKKAIWDGYVLGIGITKVGYATKFGADVGEVERKRKSRMDRVLEGLGLKKKKEDEKKFPEINKEIMSESPYVYWVSPFDYLRDPRSTSLDDAMWVCHVVDKTVEDIKKNKMFKNTDGLGSSKIDMVTDSGLRIPETEIDAFKIVKLYEIHYRQEDGFYLLYISKDGDEFRELYHEKSIYDLDDWQFDEIDFITHGHKGYKNSELTKIKTLQDRFTATVDAILEQVERFSPKIGVDETAIQEIGKRSLEEGDIGSIVYFTKNPSEAVREIGFTQVKSDLKALMDEIINIVTIQTGITKAQLLGVASGETATAETIAQGGQQLRIGDMSEEVRRFSNSQAKKLWKIITQFVDLEDVQIITGENGVNPQTGQPIFTWLEPMSEVEGLETSDLRFEMEVGSSQKLDVGVVRKSIENLITILSRTEVIALMQQQGKKVDLAEILRMWLKQTPEVFRDVSRIIQDINMNTPGLLPPGIAESAMGGGRGGETSGSMDNQLKALSGMSAPSGRQMLSEAGQI